MALDGMLLWVLIQATLNQSNEQIHFIHPSLWPLVDYGELWGMELLMEELSIM